MTDGGKRDLCIATSAGLRHPYCPMQHKTICATTTLLFMLACRTASAAPDPVGLALPAGCASVSAASMHAGSQGGSFFDATKFQVRLPPGHRAASPGNGAATMPSMEAASLHVSSHGADTSTASLERAASASATALLIALTGNGHSDCKPGLLQDAGDPIVLGLENGGSYLATWQGVTLRGAAGHVTAGRMQLRLDAAGSSGSDRLVHVTLALDGIGGAMTPAALLPDRLSLRVTLPASSLPTLLAATGGSAPDAQIPVTVDDVSVTSGDTVLHGNGEATAAATPLESTATLHLTAHNYDSLVYRAAQMNLVRVHTALLLSRLVSRHAADGIAWDVTFADGVMSVNNVPIPLR